MAKRDDFVCTECGKLLPKDELSSKKVLFGGVGLGASVFRTRTVAWLCERCLGKDPDYNFPKDMSKNERMEIARARRQEKGMGKENEEADQRRD